MTDAAGRVWAGIGAAVLILVAGQAVAAVLAQAPNPNAPANFIKLQAPIVALTHATVIDGTGAPARTQSDTRHPRRLDRGPRRRGGGDGARRRDRRRSHRQERRCPGS